MVDSHQQKLQHYVQTQAEQVRPVHQDHLHSNAYLQEHVEYIRQSFKHFRLKVVDNASPTTPKVFLRYYDLSNQSRPDVASYADPGIFMEEMERKHSQVHNAIVYIQGQPSPRWLNSLGAQLDLDIRFFYGHLGFLSQSQQDWFTQPSIPSRSRYSFKLSIPSLAFVGARRRFMSSDALKVWRSSCNDGVQKQMRALQAEHMSQTGQSVIRQVDVHTPDCLVVEQDITIHLRDDGDQWKLFIWSDAGDNTYMHSLLALGSAQVPHQQFTFCPVFFDSGSIQPVASNPQLSSSSSTTSSAPIQPLLTLAAQYGRTLKWDQASQSPILALEELFRFHACASMQCLNMIEQLINETLTRIMLSNLGFTKLMDVEIFEYAQKSLIRYTAQYNDILRFLQRIDTDSQSATCTWTGKSKKPEAERVIGCLREDLEFIRQKAQTLSSMCDSGRSTILSLASVQEGMRSNNEARLVTQLSKITYRLTFIFLPISYVTSLFGMNFKQFGQGDLDLWIWAAITVPLLVLCIFYVECGELIWRQIKKFQSCRWKAV